MDYQSQIDHQSIAEPGISEEEFRRRLVEVFGCVIDAIRSLNQGDAEGAEWKAMMILRKTADRAR